MLWLLKKKDIRLLFQKYLLMSGEVEGKSFTTLSHPLASDLRKSTSDDDEDSECLATADPHSSS
jgi:hypothetical protein